METASREQTLYEKAETLLKRVSELEEGVVNLTSETCEIRERLIQIERNTTEQDIPETNRK